MIKSWNLRFLQTLVLGPYWSYWVRHSATSNFPLGVAIRALVYTFIYGVILLALPFGIPVTVGIHIFYAFWRSVGGGIKELFVPIHEPIYEDKKTEVHSTNKNYRISKEMNLRQRSIFWIFALAPPVYAFFVLRSIWIADRSIAVPIDVFFVHWKSVVVAVLVALVLGIFFPVGHRHGRIGPLWHFIIVGVLFGFVTLFIDHFHPLNTLTHIVPGPFKTAIQIEQIWQDSLSWCLLSGSVIAVFLWSSRSRLSWNFKALGVILSVILSTVLWESLSGRAVSVVFATQRMAWEKGYEGIFETSSWYLSRKAPLHPQTFWGIDRLAEWKMSTGQTQKAVELWQRGLELYAADSQYAQKTKNYRTWVDVYADYSKPQPDSLCRPILPWISTSDYLDPSWHLILALDQKIHHDSSREKLLDFFSTEAHTLPQMSSLPELIPILDAWDLPYTISYPSLMDLKKVVTMDGFPMIPQNQGWVILESYDALRRGFYFTDITTYYDGKKKESNKKSRIFSEKSGHIDYKWEKKQWAARRVFWSEELVEDHLRNIGGVTLWVGRGPKVDSHVSRSAFLIEMGDWYYQAFRQYLPAAKCYADAYRIYPQWIAQERLLSLENHYLQQRLAWVRDLPGYAGPDIPEWANLIPMTKERRDSVEQRIKTGAAGEYIWAAWPSHDPYRIGADLDSAKENFVRLSQSKPYIAAYQDSLAMAAWQARDWKIVIQSIKRLIVIEPNRKSALSLDLAWAMYMYHAYRQIPNLLKDVTSDEFDERYYVLLAVQSLNQQDTSTSIMHFEQALKRDRFQPQAHEQLAKIYLAQGNTQKYVYHEKWYLRGVAKIDSLITQKSGAK